MNKVETKQANNAAADKRDGTLECVGGSEALGEDPAQSGLGSPYTAHSTQHTAVRRVKTARPPPHSISGLWLVWMYSDYGAFSLPSSDWMAFMRRLTTVTARRSPRSPASVITLRHCRPLSNPIVGWLAALWTPKQLLHHLSNRFLLQDASGLVTSRQ